MTNLEGKVALIMGSARGIGKAIAERFGKLGASVVVNYSGSEKRAKETVAAIERLGGAAIAVQADVAKVADILTSWSPTLGVELVGQQVVDFTEADFDRLFAINAKGAFFTLQRAARHI